MLNFLTTTTVCGFSLYHVLAFFLIYSCTGWCLEVIFAAATTGQLVNRGFLNGPVCPIYGFGMVIVLFALTPLQGSVLLLYIGGVILPSALELVGGWALYKLYHTRWWDYSDFPFNIGGYICLEFSLLWGVGTLVVMRIVHPVVAGLVDMIPPFVGFVVMCVLYAVYAADVVVTAFAASGLAKTLDAMEQLADSIHAVSDAMTQLLGTTTLNADQKLDEQRLQLKLAAAEAREAAPKKRGAAAAALLLKPALTLVESIGYLQDRLNTWSDDLEALNDQTKQSLYAIGSGGLKGLGLGNSVEKQLWLPESTNDFIFSVVCEELGFIGAVLIIVLFILLIAQGLMIAYKAENQFCTMVGIGIMAQIAWQVFCNIAVVTNTIPNTGISLPFFSSGGTSLILLLAEMGVMVNIGRNGERAAQQRAAAHAQRQAAKAQRDAELKDRTINLDDARRARNEL